MAQNEMNPQDRATFENIRAGTHQVQDTLLQVAGAGLLDVQSVVGVRQDFERYAEILRELEERYPDQPELKTLRQQLDAWQQGR